MPRAQRATVAMLVSLALPALAACAAGAGRGADRGTGHADGPATHVQPAYIRDAASEGSNVRFDDYAGSAACEPCHAEIAARWKRAPMHRMTREAAGAEIRAPFAGDVLAFKGDTVKLTADAGERFFTIEERGQRPRVFRMTRVIGGRTREDYAGVPVASADKGAALLSDGSTEWVMPVTYVFRTQRLRYKGYSVMVKERPLLHEGPEWNKTCIFCHNTVPYVDTVLGALSGKRAPYQGEVVDPLLPLDRRFTYSITDARALSRIVHAEATRLGRDVAMDRGERGEPGERDADLGARLALLGVNAIRTDFSARSLVETGIGCESCHNGARAHVEKPSVTPALAPKSPAFTIGPEGRAATRAETVNRVCARCHQVLFSGYPFTWEGGDRRASPGGSHISSGEARDMMLGHCQAELACTGCHSPHAEEHAKESAALTDAVCTRCHQELAAREKAEAHTHHQASGEGGRCVACHMPRKNLSLEGELSRYHRIGSPNEAQKVLLDRPLECALCHADKTVRELTTTMTAWWKKPYAEAALLRLYGSLDANVTLATAARGKPHEVAVAAYLLGSDATHGGRRIPRDEAFRALGAALTNEYPMVRSYARASLERLAGAPFEVDLDGEAADIERAFAAYAAAHGRRDARP